MAAAEESYIIAVVGDLAMADPDADEAQRESRLDMMKQYTKLERHGDGYELLRAQLDGPGAWSGILELFANAIAKNHAGE